MRARKIQINLATIEFDTQHARDIMDHTIKRAKCFTDDQHKDSRHQRNECPVCYYYGTRIGGSVITEVECALCGEPMVFGNTCTDKLCDVCARTNKLCKHCGGDIDVKHRRKRTIKSKTGKRG